MPALFFRDYPPCKGDEPYLYLCFHKADARRVKPFLDGLMQRRCRVWYRIGEALDSEENRAHTSLEMNAELMVFWLSDNAADDKDMKSALGHYQTTDRPVICIDMQTDTAQSGLSLILPNEVKKISYQPGEAIDELVSSLMRTEGFTQRLIDEDDRVRQQLLQKRKSRRIALSILLAAVLALVGSLLFLSSNNWFRPIPEIVNSITIADTQIEDAAREALSLKSDEPLTQEDLSKITMLHLSSAPSSFDALSLFSSLTRLEIPQSCVKEAAELLDDATYTIVVYPEGQHE